MKRALCMLGLVGAAGCATVQASHVSPGYAASDKQKVKRLLVVTSPFPGGREDVAKMWSAFTRKYVNLHRNFLVKAEKALATADLAPKSLCGEGLEGVLWLKPTAMKQAAKSVHAGVEASLVRCSDGGEVWGAKAAGGWPTEDANLSGDIQEYVGSLGSDVGSYYPSTFYLLRAALDTLPDPALTDEETNEKIELE